MPSATNSSPSSSRPRTPVDGLNGDSSLGGLVARATRNAAHIGSVVDDWPMYSSQPQDYVIGDVIGFGGSSIVYQAAFVPLGGRPCAVKVVDLEAFGRDTEGLRRETQLMSLSKHPNVLRVRGCWVEGSKLHIATRLMSAGSMLDIMRFSYPEGLEELVIATVLRQALEGLNYLHVNGWLHRDIKAGNILVDDDGTVLLGDFGVGVYLGDGSEGPDVAPKDAGPPKAVQVLDDGKRKSFVGTPCWMAPEVVERKRYGTKALELSQGRAPYSRLPAVKVLMKTLHEDPPTLDRTGNVHKYGKVFDDFVRVCLQKDPEKRPSAAQLLNHAFFKQARNNKYLTTTILAGLPPLAERQERRRAMSITSLRNQPSWDFGSVSSRHATVTSIDPFRGFTGATSIPVSPVGSVRSHAKAFDGSLIIPEHGDAGGSSEMYELWRPPSARFDGEPLSPMRFNSAGRRARNRSTDSPKGSLGRSTGGLVRHQKSASVDSKGDEEEALHATKAESATHPAHPHASAPPEERPLETIAEMRSPPLGPLSSSPPALDGIPPLGAQAGSSAVDEQTAIFGALSLGQRVQPAPPSSESGETSSTANLSDGVGGTTNDPARNVNTAETTPASSPPTTDASKIAAAAGGSRSEGPTSALSAAPLRVRKTDPVSNEQGPPRFKTASRLTKIFRRDSKS